MPSTLLCSTGVFEDLSGTGPSKTGNPYDALIEACHNDSMQIQARYNIHRTTRNSQQKTKLLDASFPGVTPDVILQKLENSDIEPEYTDPRNCLVFWARPPKKIRDLIGEIQKELQEVSPNLWLMPLQNLHMTTLEIAYSRTLQEIQDLVDVMGLRVSIITDYTFSHRARLVKPMLSYDDAAIALSFLPAADEASGSKRLLGDDDYTYHHLRRDLYDLSQGAGVTIESRYTIPSSHLTIGRFTNATDFSLVARGSESLIPDPEKMKLWVEKIEHINQWLQDEYWPSGGETPTKEGGEWIVGEEKGLDCRVGALWYGGGETIRLGQGF
ncbi:hypothetical protein FGG08_006073 [Glutinoglossum americanum]|uniref:RNA ligase/cyclic nucleotide phosphodiesterase n=1 Tax=Glutinoglossum americanum TaxID=1670608 RepID=A0A9P8L2B4_9PEZI|nr:hypothetical protein FGG08_006073 [Glutinoglossum americanum]